MHHSSEQMDWLAAARLHPIDSVFTKTVAVLPIFVLGYSRVALGGFIMFTTFQAVFIHANIRIRFSPLRWIFATPEFHHWHHANDPAAYNSNFAGEFPWLDALFGTLHLPPGQMPKGYGIEDTVPQGYLRQLASPFQPARTAEAAGVILGIAPVWRQPWSNRSTRTLVTCEPNPHLGPARTRRRANWQCTGWGGSDLQVEND